MGINPRKKELHEKEQPPRGRKRHKAQKHQRKQNSTRERCIKGGREVGGGHSSKRVHTREEGSGKHRRVKDR